MIDQKEMPEELLPCPFCGGKAMHLHTRVKSSRDETVMLDYDQIDCSVCRASTRSYCDNKEGAIKAWNKRADLAPTSQWEPISTAPRDGTEVLGYHKRLGAHLVYWGIKPRNNPNFFWISSYDEIIHIDQPTHWMALPPTKDLADAGKENK